MTRVSKNPIKQKTFIKILNTFYEMIVDLRGKQEVKSVFEVFLSKAERVMLAKRLAIAVMLKEGADYRSISQELKVSTATVREINSKLELKSFTIFISKVTKQVDKNKQMSWVEAALKAKTDISARGKLVR